MTDTNAPNTPCHVPVPDGVSECGLSELPSSIHSDDETEHDAFFVQTCVEELENADYVAGTRKHCFGSKSKKTKRFMIFDPKKGGVIF